MTLSDELSQDEALALLADDAASKTRGPRTDPTEPRIAAVWFKLPMSLTENCSNPNCIDPRPGTDKGRNVTTLIKEQHVCRYCFLDGWLSSA